MLLLSVVVALPQEFVEDTGHGVGTVMLSPSRKIVYIYRSKCAVIFFWRWLVAFVPIWRGCSLMQSAFSAIQAIALLIGMGAADPSLRSG
jgi:hypothetical protein